MPEWLTASFTQPMVDWRVPALRLAMAALFGLVVCTALRIVYRTLLPLDAAAQALVRDLAGVQSVNLRQTRTEA